jgi:uncharacterized protein YggT (Ycf19 family)
VTKLFYYLINGYQLGLAIYVMAGWFATPVACKLRLKLARFYEPLLIPIRRAIPSPRVGLVGIDLSPLILFFALQILEGLIISLFHPPF